MNRDQYLEALAARVPAPELERSRWWHTRRHRERATARNHARLREYAARIEYERRRYLEPATHGRRWYR